MVQTLFFFLLTTHGMFPGGRARRPGSCSPREPHAPYEARSKPSCSVLVILVSEEAKKGPRVRDVAYYIIRNYFQEAFNHRRERDMEN